MLLLAVGLSLLADLSTTYPIPPQPLRKLYREADLVAVVKADETVDVPGKSFGGSAKVVLTVEKTLKGRAAVSPVVAYTDPGMVCPAPASFPQGKTLLVFLRWDKELKGYYAQGLSYGSKPLEPDALKSYLRRLEELARIPEQAAGEIPNPETLDWLVRCIEDPATRVEGALEFMPIGGGRWDMNVAPIPVDRLSKAQQKRIVDAFVAPRTLDYADHYLLGMVKKIADPRIDTFIATELRYAHARNELLGCLPLMQTLDERLKLPGGKEWVEKFKEAPDDAAQRAALRAFLDLVEQQ